MEQLDQRHRIDSRNRPKYIYVYIDRRCLAEAQRQSTEEHMLFFKNWA